MRSDRLFIIFMLALCASCDRSTVTIRRRSLERTSSSFWVSDGRNDETVWLTQDGDGGRVVARAPALILAAGDQIWVGSRTKRTIRLLDGHAHALIMQRRQARDDSLDGVPVVQGEISEVLLVHASSGRKLSLSAPVVDHSTGDRPEAFTLEQQITLLSSVGPYVFVRTNVIPDWGGAHPFHETAFRVIDLRSGEDVELLTAEERARLTSKEGRHALSQMRQSGRADFQGDQDPELTLFLLSYGFGDALQAEYQFTIPSAYVGSDGRWSAYTCSNLIYSTDLPATLQEYTEAPLLLRRYWAKAPRLGVRVGWTAAHQSSRVRALLRRLFRRA